MHTEKQRPHCHSQMELKCQGLTLMTLSSTYKKFYGIVIELLKNVSSAVPSDHHNLKSKYQKSVPIVHPGIMITIKTDNKRPDPKAYSGDLAIESRSLLW